ncbi:BTB/POZ and MATH domain-containing protein 2-like [Lolium rigidum]|uniref:BTB/POZ and MATH domain-containing protein 2-like n=1 Tax=Lolium rigidum TaxID=89674 RepID=UPI001F5C497B|nr:BTB/POZ and MATH domain-containing protein 2-like [Lolium rigidum]
MPTSSNGSASSIVAGTISGYHTLKISCYLRTKQETPNGQHIDSRPFQVGGCKWRVRYYPNGNKSKDIDFISLYLSLDDTLAEGETVKAGINFSLLDKDGKPVPSYTFLTTETRDFSVGRTCWGLERFIERAELEKSEHLKEDSFTVKVDVTIMGQCRALETPLIVVPPSDMHRHFGDLLSSKAGVDVEFRVGGETFSAHRSVLAARSPVFRAQLFGPMKESTTASAIGIDDMEAQVFNALLSFMYTDELPDMKQEEEYAMAQHLLVAADRYDLDRLKLICEDMLTTRIDMSSVATILTLADQHHCPELKEACLVFLSEPANLDQAIESVGFELLTKTCPGVIKDFLKSQVIPSLLGKRKSRT